MGIRRTLYGQTTLTGADRSQAPPSGGKASRKASRWSLEIPEAARELGISEATFLRSLKKPIHGGMSTSEAKRLKELYQGALSRSSIKELYQGALKKENARLKKLVAENRHCGHRHPKGGESGKLLSIRPGEEGRRRSRPPATAGGLRASGVQGDRPAQIEPALRGVQDAKGSPASRGDGSALAGESPLWLPRRVWAMLWL
jgi:hypothetical protein